MKDAILNAATTPQGLIILVVFAFIALTLLITAVFFIVAGVVKRRRTPKLAASVDRSEDFAAAEPSSQPSSRTEPVANRTEDVSAASNDPLATFVPPPKTNGQSSKSSKAPIGLARLREAAEDFVAPTRREPELTAAQVPTSAQQPMNLEDRVYAERLNDQPAMQAAPMSRPTTSGTGTATASPSFAYENPQAVLPIRTPGASSRLEHAAKPISPLSNAQILLTLPFERRPGLTTAHAELCGMGIEAVFFDPELVARIEDDPIRLVPFLPPDMGRILFRESDRETFRAGPLFAQPDAVIELTTGLIALEFKSKGGRPEDPIRWAEAMREKDLLQTVVNALVLSAESGRPVAPVLRTHNAVFFLRPGEAVQTLLKDNVDGAISFLDASMQGLDRPGISALDYAGLMQVGIAKRFPKPRSISSAYGEAAHKALLR